MIAFGMVARTYSMAASVSGLTISEMPTEQIALVPWGRRVAVTEPLTRVPSRSGAFAR